MVIERGQAVILLFLDNQHGETCADQWAEMSQSFECTFQVGTGHHGIADDLKHAGMEVLGQFQTDVWIAGRLSRQIQQAVDSASFAEGSR
ncbi:hypothetical protein PS639_04291 [Pseudomonas fluorescens]|nr:hypothetical protein PS639_04291 [Pseudomonas fluorescens]